MLRPVVAYLRVYEPLSAFGDPPADWLRQAVRRATKSDELTRASAGQREHDLWLKSQVAAPRRLLPAELANGRPAPSNRTDVLLLDPAEVPAKDDVRVGPGPLVCPLDMRARSAAALVSFLGDAHPMLRAEAMSTLGTSPEAARTKAAAALGDLTGTAVHALSTTWTVPLPWFALVEPLQRRVVPGQNRYDPAREISWRVAMPDARERATKAKELVENTLGESGPSRILGETVRWLDNFDSASAVELDYGGIVQLFDDATLAGDDSAEQVHGILNALRDGEMDSLAELFESLRDFWSGIAAMEHAN